MKRTDFRWIAACAVLTLMPGTAQCQQFVERPHAEAYWDFRVQPATRVDQKVGLYSGSIAFKAGLAPDLKVDLNAERITKGFYASATSTRVVFEKATVEKSFGRNRLLAGVIRLPFGIYDRQETYASGLIAYPLTRSDYALASVNWGVPGLSLAGGAPNLQFEAALFDGDATGDWANLQKVSGRSIRAQAYVPNLIVGLSHWDGYINMPGPSGWFHTTSDVNGLDFRYTQPHLLVRGEMMFGVLGGNRMDGWYLDTYYHLPRYERLTLVARAESFRPAPGIVYARQITLGARYTLAPGWTLALNWRRNNMDKTYTATWTPYSGRGGAVLLQVYHKMGL